MDLARAIFGAPVTLIFLLTLLPWIALPIIALVRGANSRQLSDESPDVPPDATLLSIVIPARNEERNIDACVRAALASTYTPLEVIVVDDHSTDRTADHVRAIARHDPRLKLIENPNLPPGWFGKQWACQNGADAASGQWILFLDADTRLAPEAVARALNAARRTNADFLSVLSHQEFGTFWERVVQPQILAVIAARYGGTEVVNRAKHPHDKIANGQFILVPTATYRTLGGHSIVRAHVAEDLKLAQMYFAAGRTTTLILGWDYVTTRMYTSLHEVIAGWRKNVFAGGREGVPFGAVGQAIFPLALLTPPILQLIPIVVGLAALLGFASTTVLYWSLTAIALTLAWWCTSYKIMRVPLRYALAYPLGAAITAYTFASAIARGQNVTWKGREYRSDRIPSTSTPQ